MRAKSEPALAKSFSVRLASFAQSLCDDRLEILAGTTKPPDADDGEKHGETVASQAISAAFHLAVEEPVYDIGEEDDVPLLFLACVVPLLKIFRALQAAKSKAQHTEARDSEAAFEVC